MTQTYPTANRLKLAAAALALIAGALYTHSGHAQNACGAQSDFLVRSDPLLAPVRPVDCATVFQAPPDFTWPAQRGDNVYTVTLTFPDGHTEVRRTSTNWLAWDEAVPAGRYAWTVAVSGAANKSGAQRTFTIN
jgi:hypothetical protein